MMTKDPRNEWEPLVGKLVLLCGDIELFLLQLYWNIRLNEPYDKNIKNLGLGDKAKMIREVVKSLSISKNLKNKINKALETTIRIAHERNLVVHNPLYLDVYSFDEGGIKYVQNIRSLRKHEKHMTLKRLMKVIKQTKSLTEELHGLVVQSCEEA